VYTAQASGRAGDWSRAPERSREGPGEPWTPRPGGQRHRLIPAGTVLPSGRRRASAPPFSCLPSFGDAINPATRKRSRVVPPTRKPPRPHA